MTLWKGEESNLLYIMLPFCPPLKRNLWCFFYHYVEMRWNLDDSKFPEKVNKYNNTQWHTVCTKKAKKVRYMIKSQRSWHKELQERRTERKREGKSESVGGRQYFQLHPKDEWILASTVKAILFWFYNSYRVTNAFSAVIKMLPICLGILP